MPQYAVPMSSDFSGPPPAYVEVEEFDCLHEEGAAYAGALEKAGVAVQLEDVAGTFHGFDFSAGKEISKIMVEKRIQALTIGWTQDVVILDAELIVQERAWYIRAVQQFGWSKVELQRQIASGEHKENALYFEGEMCYTEENFDSIECAEDDKSAFCLPREYTP